MSWIRLPRTVVIDLFGWKAAGALQGSPPILSQMFLAANCSDRAIRVENPEIRPTLALIGSHR